MTHALTRPEIDEAPAIRADCRGCIDLRLAVHEILLRNRPMFCCLLPESTVIIRRTLDSAPFQMQRPIGIESLRCSPEQCQWLVLSDGRCQIRFASANQKISAASAPPSATLS